MRLPIKIPLARSQWTNHCSRLAALSAAAFLICWCQGAETNRVETNRAPAEVVFPKSVFVDDTANGKDPFFPTRNRGPIVVVPKPSTQDKEPNWKAIALRGISGIGDQKYALINTLPFAKGEEGEVKVGATKVRIKVIEIKEKSVVISIEGVPGQKELVLPDRLLGVGAE